MKNDRVITIPSVDDEHFLVEVLFDGPLDTFMGCVHDRAIKDAQAAQAAYYQEHKHLPEGERWDERDTVLFWPGAMPNEKFPTVESLEEVLVAKGYITCIPPGVKDALNTAQQARGGNPTPFAKLLERMFQGE